MTAAPKPVVEERSDDLLSFVRNLPCLVCTLRVTGRPIPSHGSHPHHVHSRGTHGDVNNVVPLCPHHHTGDEGIHVLGKVTWGERFGLPTAKLERVAVQVTEDWRKPDLEGLPW